MEALVNPGRQAYEDARSIAGDMGMPIAHWPEWHELSFDQQIEWADREAETNAQLAQELLDDEAAR